MFAVQRVRSVKETGETFDDPADFRVADFMKGSFRACGRKATTMSSCSSGSLEAGWVRERQWDPSQVLEDQPDGSRIVKFHLSDLRLQAVVNVMWHRLQGLGVPGTPNMTRKRRYQCFSGRGCNSRRLHSYFHKSFSCCKLRLRKTRVSFPPPRISRVTHLRWRMAERPLPYRTVIHLCGSPVILQCPGGK